MKATAATGKAFAISGSNAAPGMVASLGTGHLIVLVQAPTYGLRNI